MIYDVRDGLMQIDVHFMNRVTCACFREDGATDPGWYYQSSADKEGQLIGPYDNVDDIFEFFPDAKRALGNEKGFK